MLPKNGIKTGYVIAQLLIKRQEEHEHAAAKMLFPNEFQKEIFILVSVYFTVIIILLFRITLPGF